MYNYILDKMRRFGTSDVIIDPAIYQISKRWDMSINQTIRGLNKHKTKLVGSVAFDYVFVNDGANNSTVKNLTFNLGNVTAASAIAYVNTNYNLVSDCVFLRGALNSWQVKFNNEVNKINIGNNVINCDFINHTGSLEALLISNQTLFICKNNYFSQKIGGAFPQLGIWEKVNNSIIESCVFEDSTIPLYYSISCNDLIFRNLTFNNCGKIKGSNVSDTGTFGQTFVDNYLFENIEFIGGDNSKNDYALQLGAVKNSICKNINVKGHQGGILFTKANNNVYTSDLSSNIDIYNINITATTHANPQAISNAFSFERGNNWEINVYGGVIDGFQFPISLNGTGTHANIKFYNVTFKNYTQLVKLNDGQTDNTGVQFIDCIF